MFILGLVIFFCFFPALLLGTRKTRRAMSQSVDGMNGRVNGINGSPTKSFNLPGVDPDKLKSRLYSYAPQQAATNPAALKFKKTTPAQRITRAKPTAAKLEPLVSKP